MRRTDVDHDFRRFAERGDVSALGRVFDRVAPELLIIAAHVSRGDEAEDLVQSTFVEAIHAADRHDPARAVLPWLIGILANVAAAERRRSARRRRSPPVVEGFVEDPAAATEQRELVAVIERVIEKLPTPYRHALVLRLVHGLTPTEIGHALGEPIPTVKARLRRGLDLVRQAVPGGAAIALTASLEGEAMAAARRKAMRCAAVKASLGSLTALPDPLTGGIALKTLLAAITVFGLGLAGRLIPTTDAGDGEPTPAPPALLRSTNAAETADVLTPLAPVALRRLVSAADHGALTIHFVWADDGTPARNCSATVSWTDANGERRTRQVRGHEVGIARIEGLPPGGVRISRRSQPTPIEATIVAGETTSSTIRVDAAFVVIGTVLEPDGEPATDARVYLEDIGPLVPLVKTDARGRFRTHLHRDGTVAATAPGWAPSFTVDLDAPASSQARETELTLKLREAAMPARGVVVDHRGRPAPRARIAVQTSRRAPRNSGLRVSPPVLLRADEHGCFSTDQLPAGRWWLYAQAEDGGPVAAERVTAPTPTDPWVIALPAPIAVIGIARDHDGVPVSDVTVSTLRDLRYVDGHTGVVTEFESRVSCQSDEDGRFRLDGLRPGTYRVVARGPGRTETEATLSLEPDSTSRWDPILSRITPASGPLVAKPKQSERGGRFRVHLDGIGWERDGIEIHAIRTGEGDAQPSIDWVRQPDDTFLSSEAPGGSYQLLVTGVGIAPTPLTADLSGGDERALHVTARPAPVVAITLVPRNMEKDWVSGVVFQARRLDDADATPRVRAVRRAVDGEVPHWRCSLLPGRYVIRAFLTSHGSRGEVEVIMPSDPKQTVKADIVVSGR